MTSFDLAISKALAPPDRRPIAEWIEDHRILPRGSAVEGPKRLSLTPALRPIYEWFRDPFIREIVVLKSAQIGYTDALVDLILWIAANDPAPTALFLADQATAKKMMHSRIRPALDSVGIIRKRTAEKKQDATSYEIRAGNGFYLVVSWASSIAATASMAYKYVFCDELDKPGYSTVGAEGDTIGRIRERTETYPDHKILWGSTPTLESGLITKEYRNADVRYEYCVPCPKCGTLQPLRFSPEKLPSGEMTGGITWAGGHGATREQVAASRYSCSSCGAGWTTDEKARSISLGGPANLGDPCARPRVVGYQLNRLLSLFPGGALDALVGNWCRSHDDPGKIQNFVNSSLGQPWVARVGKSLDERQVTVMQCKTDLEPNTIPEEAVALIAGIDMQQAGFWYRLRAFAIDGTSWGIAEGSVASWADLDRLLFETQYPCADGVRKFPIWRALIDTGGTKANDAFISRTEEAYEWIRANRGRCQIFPCKGSSASMATKLSLGKPLERTPSGKPIPGGLQIISVNTMAIKDIIWWRIERAQTQEPGSLYLHRDTPGWYAKHMTAEEKRIDRKTGHAEYVQVSRDNHILDCEVLCEVGADSELMGGVRVIRPPAKPKPQNTAKEKGSTSNPWMRGTIGG